MGYVLLREPRNIAANIWRIRERTEYEVGSLFARLAADMAASGAPESLVRLAIQCGDDEREHALHCRRIIEELDPGLAPLEPDMHIVLGVETTPSRRALFTSVALGCVTESLSTALLIEMRRGARLGAVRSGLDKILEDEIRHSRLGWAHLAHEAERGDVSWLGPSVQGMIRAALPDDVSPTSHTAPADLREYGILARADVDRICDATIESTIRPGLTRFGVRL